MSTSARWALFAIIAPAGKEQVCISLSLLHPAYASAARGHRTVLSGKRRRQGNIDGRDISSVMIEFPGTWHYFIGARNWLALEPDAQQRIWANWHVEDEPYPYTQASPSGF
jgi:hypothetical protein